MASDRKSPYNAPAVQKVIEEEFKKANFNPDLVVIIAVDMNKGEMALAGNVHNEEAPFIRAMMASSMLTKENWPSMEEPEDMIDPRDFTPPMDL